MDIALQDKLYDMAQSIAFAKNIDVSKYIAEIIKKDAENEWVQDDKGWYPKVTGYHGIAYKRDVVEDLMKSDEEKEYVGPMSFDEFIKRMHSDE